MRKLKWGNKTLIEDKFSLMKLNLEVRFYFKCYPTFECENCIGDNRYGCQCSYYGATSPGKGPNKIYRIMRKINHLLFGDCHKIEQIYVTLDNKE